MKNKFLLLFMTAILSLVSCSSEDPIPLEDVAGEFEDFRIEMTHNGNVVPNEYSNTIVRYLAAEEAGLTSDKGTLQIILKRKWFSITQSHYLFSDEYGCDYVPYPMVFMTKAISNEDCVSFEGSEELYSEGNDYSRYSVTGSYRRTKIDGIPMKISLMTEVNKEGLTGKTFEMRFDEDAFECLPTYSSSCRLPNTGKKPEDALADFMKLLSSNYVKDSGIDAMRFTFNPDGSITVKAHMVETGEYVEQNTKSTYQVLPDNRMLICQDDAWTQQFVKYYSPYSDICVTSPFGLFDWAINVTNTERLVEMSVTVENNDDELVFIPRTGLRKTSYDGVKSFLQLWLREITPTTDAEKLYEDITYALRYKVLEIKIRLISHPVNE